MLEWKEHGSSYAEAKTQLIQLSVQEALGMYGIQGAYFGRVSTAAGVPLTSRDDLPSMAEARAWCEAEYKALLQAELSRFTPLA